MELHDHFTKRFDHRLWLTNQNQVYVSMYHLIFISYHIFLFSFFFRVSWWSILVGSSLTSVKCPYRSGMLSWMDSLDWDTGSALLTSGKRLLRYDVIVCLYFLFSSYRSFCVILLWHNIYYFCNFCNYKIIHGLNLNERQIIWPYNIRHSLNNSYLLWVFRVFRETFFATQLLHGV